ncbi:MAG: hypothetical protein ACRD9R_01920 [Pyrinomonadaceae bacterium]
MLDSLYHPTRFVHYSAEIVPADILAWREHLHTVKKSSASTVALKLSVIRSMYDYLLLAGYVSTNPALAKLVPPPSLPEDLRGRALLPKEVRHLLSGPDRSRPDGARDYALLLLMLKTSLRVTSTTGRQGRVSQMTKMNRRRLRALPVKHEMTAEDVARAVADPTNFTPLCLPARLPPRGFAGLPLKLYRGKIFDS